jgi:N-sulfoglucosamine sulfohydrolase
VRWPSRLPKGVTVSAFVSHADLAPTFLKAAGLTPPSETTGRDLLPTIVPGTTTPPSPERDAVFLERERHANVRAGNLSYPCRAIRTTKFLYIRNLRPDRWPAGDPVLVHSVGPFGDVDPSPTKDLILDHRGELAFASPFRLAFEKRPAEELYDLEHDPFQLKNIAHHESYAAARADLRARLDRWMLATGDPLARDHEPPGREPFDDYPYVGPPVKPEKP